MLNRNRIDFIYENEKNFNFFIKLYKNIKLLGIIKIRKLPVFCLLYFMTIQSSTISNHGQETNIEDVLIKIQEENGTEKEDNGVVSNLDYKAKLDDGENTEFTINSLEYSGIRIANGNCDADYGFSNLKLNDQGKFEGKDMNGNDILGNEILIYYLLFYANITIGDNIINTFIRILPSNHPVYNNIDIYEVKPSHLWVYLRVDSNGIHSGTHYDCTARCYESEFFKNYKLFTLNNKIISIKISNFKNAGYIYYPNINSQKFERITVKLETSSELDKKIQDNVRRRLHGKKKRGNKARNHFR